jgi:hypothetical protein
MFHKTIERTQFIKFVILTDIQSTHHSTNVVGVETSVNVYKTTRRHNPVDHNLHVMLCEVWKMIRHFVRKKAYNAVYRLYRQRQSTPETSCISNIPRQWTMTNIILILAIVKKTFQESRELCSLVLKMKDLSNITLWLSIITIAIIIISVPNITTIK